MAWCLVTSGLFCRYWTQRWQTHRKVFAFFFLMVSTKAHSLTVKYKLWIVTLDAGGGRRLPAWASGHLLPGHANQVNWVNLPTCWAGAELIKLIGGHFRLDPRSWLYIGPYYAHAAPQPAQEWAGWAGSAAVQLCSTLPVLGYSTTTRNKTWHVTPGISRRVGCLLEVSELTT